MNARQFLTWYVSKQGRLTTHVSRNSSAKQLAKMSNEEKKIVGRLLGDIQDDLARDRKRQRLEAQLFDNELLATY
jgi:hypothetical protein